MWLLNATTYNFYFVQESPRDIAYAILSHVWDNVVGEQTFQDLQSIHTSAREAFPKGDIADDDPYLLAFIRARLSPKIVRCCDYARARGILYAWIDTCCIDKTNSAELSEAINSMYDWYSHAVVCYVHLADVAAENPEAQYSDFRYSSWFRRGWTLQELIVPRNNIFLSKNWQMLGTKASLAGLLEDITGIDQDILLRRQPLHSVSVARRMSWAARRETTRVEDEAYCLMGIFGVRLPVIYGEGSFAFIRLQEEIMQRIPDLSLFAWGLMLPLTPLDNSNSLDSAVSLPVLKRTTAGKLRASKSAYLLASRPEDFQYSFGFSSIPPGSFADRVGLSSWESPPHMPTSHGVRTTLPVLVLSFPSVERGSSIEVLLALLPCQDANGRLPALVLSALPSAASRRFVGGLEPEHGFMHDFHGIVTPLNCPFDPSDLGSSCLLEISRSEWVRNARAAALRCAPQTPRLMLLDQSVLDAVVGKEGRVALQDVCIPCHRLHGELETAVFARPRWAEEGFKSYCSVVLPCWTLAHLRRMGVAADVVIKENGEMKPVSLYGYPLRHRSFKLFHDTQTVVVTMFGCPAGRTIGPLHVSVAWEGRRSDSDFLRHVSQCAMQVTTNRK
ncbi:heterokaryon incompatibility protein-domain-containing protein [Trametes elegans]|nr:heterokaryon incompatibility protein-domain-containing protein [Trametes elegans]